MQARRHRCGACARPFVSFAAAVRCFHRCAQPPQTWLAGASAVEREAMRARFWEAACDRRRARLRMAKKSARAA